MKLTHVLLAASLVVNAALVVAFVAGVSGDDSSVSRATAATAVSASVRAANAVPTGVDPELWNKLPAADWPALVSSLRAKGFPPSIIRAIVAAQISENFRDRRKAFDTAVNDTPFWKNPLPDPKTLAAQRALSREQQKLMEDIFGKNPDADDPMTAVYNERQFSGVPAEKRDQISQIMREFSEQRSDVYERNRGNGYTTDDQAKLRQLDNLQHAEIAKVLTPDELEAYDLRNSNAANSLKSQLVAFDPTEDEFKTLYKLQSAFDSQWGQMYAPTQDELRARSAAQNDLQKQIEAALGPDRFADYQRASDYNYRQTTALVARLELPPETANNLYAVQKEFEQRRSAAVQTPVPQDQRMAQLTALQQEAVARVTPILGNNATAVEAYQQYGGRWLQNLAPRPAPTRPPTPVRN